MKLDFHCWILLLGFGLILELMNLSLNHFSVVFLCIAFPLMFGFFVRVWREAIEVVFMNFRIHLGL